MVTMKLTETHVERAAEMASWSTRSTEPHKGMNEEQDNNSRLLTKSNISAKLLAQSNIESKVEGFIAGKAIEGVVKEALRKADKLVVNGKDCGHNKQEDRGASPPFPTGSAAGALADGGTALLASKFVEGEKFFTETKSSKACDVQTLNAEAACVGTISRGCEQQTAPMKSRNRNDAPGKFDSDESNPFSLEEILMKLLIQARKAKLAAAKVRRTARLRVEAARKVADECRKWKETAIKNKIAAQIELREKAAALTAEEDKAREAKLAAAAANRKAKSRLKAASKTVVECKEHKEVGMGAQIDAQRELREKQASLSAGENKEKRHVPPDNVAEQKPILNGTSEDRKWKGENYPPSSWSKGKKFKEVVAGLDHLVPKHNSDDAAPTRMYVKQGGAEAKENQGGVNRVRKPTFKAAALFQRKLGSNSNTRSKTEGLNSGTCHVPLETHTPECKDEAVNHTSELSSQKLESGVKRKWQPTTERVSELQGRSTVGSSNKIVHNVKQKDPKTPSVKEQKNTSILVELENEELSHTCSMASREVTLRAVRVLDTAMAGEKQGLSAPRSRHPPLFLGNKQLGRMKMASMAEILGLKENHKKDIGRSVATPGAFFAKMEPEWM